MVKVMIRFASKDNICVIRCSVKLWILCEKKDSEDVRIKMLLGLPRLQHWNSFGNVVMSDSYLRLSVLVLSVDSVLQLIKQSWMKW